MRKPFLTMVVIILCFIAVDASACAQCGTHPNGCDYCYESGYDGGQSCVLLAGVVCYLQDPNGCEGYIDRWCPGGHCPDDQEARIDGELNREWRLESVEVIRPEKAVVSQTGA